MGDLNIKEVGAQVFSLVWAIVILFALKFYTRIRLRKKDSEERLILLRDNGVDIEKNIKDKVFSPLFTTKTTCLSISNQTKSIAQWKI